MSPVPRPSRRAGVAQPRHVDGGVSLDDRKVHGNGKDYDALLVRDVDGVSGVVEALAKGRPPHLTKAPDCVIKSSLVAWEVHPIRVRLGMIAINDRREIARQGRSPLNITACGPPAP